ncbi:MAG: hypothetical protein LUE11_09240 [Clostridia bacterium]|nr:hypothetical protein [Clostridia bacterium]
MLEAFDLLESGKSKCITVNMNNDVAEEEGIACRFVMENTEQLKLWEVCLRYRCIVIYGDGL